MNHFKLILLIPFSIISLLVNQSCKKEIVDEKIVAKIGNKSITVKDLTYRAEMTIRPVRFFDKNIVLNNLIAEKLFAMELADTSQLLKNEYFKGYINGIKEQAMREQLYYHEAYDKAIIDTAEILKNFRLSGFEYTVQFYRIRKKTIVDTLKKKLNTDNPEIRNSIFSELEEHIDKKPIHTVKWEDPEADVIHDALYSDTLKVGTIIGPLTLAKNDHLIMKIIDWTYTPTIGKESVQLKLKKIEEKLKQRKANKIWKSYVRNIMAGKKMTFNKEILKKVADLFYETYSSNDLNENTNIDQKMSESDSNLASLRTIANDEVLLASPFFKIDDKDYTVRDFRNLIMSHPLVYRKKFINKDEFNYQFRLAIADLMRDHHLNQEAYKKSLHKNYKVIRKVSIWEDALKAQHQMGDYLKNLKKGKNFDKRKLKGDHNYVRIYVDSLVDKYSKLISINTEELKQIQLTNIQLIGMQANVPYPIAFPNFPLYTTKSKMDHYQIMKNK
jgi:hypothetical protein